MMIGGRIAIFAAVVFAACAAVQAAPRKAYTAVQSAARKEPYSKAGDPAGAATGEDALKIRALLVDGSLKEWTTGDTHDVTGRSFVVRREIRLNDSLPSDKAEPNESKGLSTSGNIGFGSGGRGCSLTELQAM